MCDPTACVDCPPGDTPYCEGNACACKCEEDACSSVDCGEPLLSGQCDPSCQCLCDDGLCLADCEASGKGGGHECDGTACRCCEAPQDFTDEGACQFSCDSYCGECDHTCFGALCVCGDT
jgi:hypothetical protein